MRMARCRQSHRFVAATAMHDNQVRSAGGGGVDSADQRLCIRADAGDVAEIKRVALAGRHRTAIA